MLLSTHEHVSLPVFGILHDFVMALMMSLKAEFAVNEYSQSQEGFAPIPYMPFRVA